MNSVFKADRPRCILLLFLSIMTASASARARQDQGAPTRVDTLSVAREYMQAVRYCALITVDSTGQPHVRTMDPFPPDESMVVWLGTNRQSRKVAEIRRNPRVALYYSDEKGVGYVAIMGKACLVDDAKEKAVRWKEEWKAFYPDRQASYILIKVIPEKLEIVNYKHRIFAGTATWQPPSVKF